MKKRFTACIILLAAGAAAAAPFAQGDAKAGKALYDKAQCAACHAGRYGGDGSLIYTRPEHKVKSADALLKQVRFCAAQVGAQWFPDEEEHVAAYLNQQYYKFK